MTACSPQGTNDTESLFIKSMYLRCTYSFYKSLNTGKYLKWRQSLTPFNKH